MRIRHIKLFVLIVAINTVFIESALAYIGPGAGFAFFSSFLIFLITFGLIVFYLISWPIRFALRGLLRKNPRGETKSSVKRVIVIGLDSMDPHLTNKFMREGLLPNFKKLKEEGTYSSLATSYPAISPVAWSSFMTGVDPSYHNIFDFLTRDPRTYTPMLSSSEIINTSRILSVGKYKIPLGKPKIKLLRKSKPFWAILGENGIFSSIIRVPITFPPEKFKGVLISGMCVPDLKGTQGTFSFYTTKESTKKEETGGVCYHVESNNGAIHTNLRGPENSLLASEEEMTVPLSIKIEEGKNSVKLQLCGQTFELEAGNYSPWIKVLFRPGLGMKISGICRFYLNCVSPELELYVSPINIDPERPALPISHPFIYSVYLAKLIGPYGTLGLQEDTWALNENVMDEEAYLKQVNIFHEERERMFFNVLDKTKNGLCVFVFDALDRIQHMFFRCLDETHPANKGKEVEKYKDVIKDFYIRLDGLVGRVLDKADEKTVIIVMSDHGFTQFKRGCNLNTWLLQNGYLELKDGTTTNGDWFDGVDWEKTKAYSFGLAGIYINRKGRESKGIVEDGTELSQLKRDLIEKLTGLVDEATGDLAVREVIDTKGEFVGPYTDDAPDLLIGYNSGYRTSWECATGQVTANVFDNNTRPWSGDHCVDPKLVPGIFFANCKSNISNPDIKDIAPTVLDLFGVDIPSYMRGTPLLQRFDPT